MNDTITAIVTPKINSAISVIRISGPNSYDIISSLCKQQIEKKGYTFIKKQIFDEQKIVDDVIILRFVEPRSYTGEDVIEINCHGGILVTNKILELILKNGARLAENGEFTKRAFINNKLTLRQANSINNLINSKTNESVQLASEGIINTNNSFFDDLSEQLFNLIGKIEVNIDYPEYDDVEQVTLKSYFDTVNNVLKQLEETKSKYEKISHLYKGLNVAIIGKPNVGKSSLLNSLIKKDRAIVSNVKGTTRDTINESVVIDGILLNFIDTAGIRKSNNKIENIGIKKTYSSIKEADLVLFVIDSSKKLDAYEQEILKKLKNKKYIIVKNKSDLQKDANKNLDGILISAKNKKIEKLIDGIKSYLNKDDFDIASNLSICSDNEMMIVNELISVLKKSLKNAKTNIPIDILVEDITYVYKKICSLCGKTQDLDLIDKMFKNFCLGK